MVTMIFTAINALGLGYPRILNLLNAETVLSSIVKLRASLPAYGVNGVSMLWHN